MKLNFNLNHLYMLIIPAFVLSYARFSFFSGNHVVYFLYIVFFLLNILNKSQSIKVSYSFKPYYILAITTMFVCPVLCGNFVDINGLLYSLLLILFMISIILFSGFIVEELNYNFLLSFWCISIQMLILLYVVLNIKEINSTTIKAFLFDNNSDNLVRVRASFGLGHPNSAALVITSGMLISYCLLCEVTSVKIKFLIILNIVIDTISLCCTGSRTGVIVTVIFLLSEFIFSIIKKINKYRYILVFLFIICIGIIFDNIDYATILNQTSGRDKIIFSSFEKLSSFKVLFFGYRVSNISDSSDVFNNNSFSGTDNWYYMWIIRFGLLGTFGFMLVVFGSFLKVYRLFLTKSNVKSYYLSMIIGLLFYGLGENCIFNQGVILSFVVLSLFFRQLAVIDCFDYQYNLKS